MDGQCSSPLAYALLLPWPNDVNSLDAFEPSELDDKLQERVKGIAIFGFH
jgi:hypothetical protein